MSSAVIVTVVEVSVCRWSLTNSPDFSVIFIGIDTNVDDLVPSTREPLNPETYNLVSTFNQDWTPVHLREARLRALPSIHP